MSISTTFTLKFAGAAVERGLARVQSVYKGLGNMAAKVGKMLLSPFAGIAAAAGGLLAARSLIRTAVELNAIGEAGRAGDRALANVTNQMGLFGNKADDVTKRLIDYADVVSRSNGVDGESIGIAQTKLMTFKELAKSADVAGGAFDRATMAAIDMASAGFGSAETNAVQLGKALNDPIKGINSLTRSGITFTTQEKAKIAELVKSNQILKAQDIILKSIETQVGGTAAASATSSGKIKASFAQIKDAFAEPLSMGIDSMPGALESVFPKIIAKAEELGTLIGKTIQEAVSGDMTRLVEIGELIGTAIGGGMKIGIKAGGREIAQSFWEILEETNPIRMTDWGSKQGKISDAFKENKGDAVRKEIESLVETLRPMYDSAAVQKPTPSKWLGEGLEQSSTMNGKNIEKILNSIDRKLSPQP